MNSENREREFQIKPPKTRPVRSDDAAAFQRIVRVARMSRLSQRKRKRAGGAPALGQHEFKQRCAVRVTYSPNKTPGQWKAHGRYLARETATPDEQAGFG